MGGRMGYTADLENLEKIEILLLKWNPILLVIQSEVWTTQTGKPGSYL
jgi:hypothetical protein